MEFNSFDSELRKNLRAVVASDKLRMRLHQIPDHAANVRSATANELATAKENVTENDFATGAQFPARSSFWFGFAAIAFFLFTGFSILLVILNSQNVPNVARRLKAFDKSVSALPIKRKSNETYASEFESIDRKIAQLQYQIALIDRISLNDEFESAVRKSKTITPSNSFETETDGSEMAGLMFLAADFSQSLTATLIELNFADETDSDLNARYNNQEARRQFELINQKFGETKWGELARQRLAKTQKQ
jgi:hypothetical protein